MIHLKTEHDQFPENAKKPQIITEFLTPFS